MKSNNLTIEDIAKALGVSKTTVSRAMSGKGRISQATRDRVMEYVEQVDFTPNVLARGLAQSRTYNIAVVMPDDYCLTEMPFFMNCLSGIHRVAVSHGYDVLLTMGDNQHLDSMKNVITNKKADGIILMRTYVEDHAVQYLQEQDVPFVVLGSHPDPNVVQVDQKHRQACMELTGQIIDKGYKKIALLGGDRHHLVSRHRYEGFVDAFEKRNQKVNETFVFRNLLSSNEMEQAAMQAIEQGADCLVCMDDNICDIVLRKLQRSQVAIPDQISIASFFDSPLWENQKPSITCLSFDVYSQGKNAAESLIKRIEGEHNGSSVKMKYKVEMKGSTR